MRVATYNVENLFNRPKAMNLETWRDGRKALDAFAELNGLLGAPIYAASDKARMVELMTELGLHNDDDGPFVILRRNRGHLLHRPRAGGLVIDAAGRGDWIGSLDLKMEPIEEIAVQNTARVLARVNADIQVVVEADSRVSLVQFNETILRPVTGLSFASAMLIDGNDPRGIDVGLYLKPGFAIEQMRSHVDDRAANGHLIFSRDCAMFRVTTPSGKALWLLANHLKSKGFGKPAESSARRRLQAERILEIYRALRAAGETNIIILGDFNDSPDSAPLASLLGEPGLSDASLHPSFDRGGFEGTFGSCAPDDKIDYILLTDPLFNAITGGAYERHGLWPGVRPQKWDKLPELTKPDLAASDHAAMWVDVGL